MTLSNQDELARAYSILKSLRKNVGDMEKTSIAETYVQQYNSSLNKLSSIGINISDFEVPSSEINTISIPYIVTMVQGKPAPPTPRSKEKYIDKSYFLMKIDAVLNYFEIINSPEPKRIGFHKHND